MAIREKNTGIENFLDLVIVPGTLVERARNVTENYKEDLWDSDAMLIKAGAYAGEALKVGAYAIGIMCL